jgi:biotin operon repressor
MRAALLAGYIPGDLSAFKPYAPNRMRLHKPVVNVIEKVVDVIADAADWVIDKVIDPVLTTVSSVIEAALDNPVKTIAQIAAVATGNAWALPLIEGADVAAKGGDLGDVLEATAKAYVMQEVGSYVGKAAGAAAGDYAGTLEYADEATKLAAQKVATEVVGAAAGSAAVAVVSGQDPLKALIAGGVGAAVPAVLGKVDMFKALPGSAQRVIASAVSAQLSGGNVTAAVVNSAIAASGIVTNALRSFDPDGTKLDNTQRAILTDVLMGTATAAITGGNPANVVSAAMMKAGSKALGDMATSAFKSATASTTEAYKSADVAAAKVDANIAAQNAKADEYNAVANELKGRMAEQDRLKTVYNNAVAAHNANPSDATAAAANAAIRNYNNYVTRLNADYANVYQPKLTKYGGELDKLKQDYAVKTGDYEKAIQAFGTKTDALSDVLDPIYRTSNRAFVEVMDEKFNPDQYRKLNGLSAEDDPYEHYLATGQFTGAPTNNEAAKPVIAAERTRLVTEALASKGVTLATADPAMVSNILNNIDKNYGNNIGALKGASIQDVINGNTTSINQLVADQKNGVFRAEVNGVSYGAWKTPPTDSFTLAPGTKLASFESFNTGKASMVYDTKGRPVWIENDPSTAIKSWNPATGNYEPPTVTIVGKKPTEQEKILAIAELDKNDVAQGVVSQAVLNAAQTLVGWAQKSGNSTLINTTANIMKAGGGFVESINGMSVLLGVAPSSTKMGKFADALQNIGKAGNTAEYQAAVANMKSIIGNAKGVGGTLQAIYGAFESAPLQFIAEYVGVEGFQEVAPLLIGGLASTGAKGAALALNYGKAVAAKMGTAAGMTAAIATDIAESAGGAAKGAYDEAYKAAIKVGKPPAEADKIAMEIAQRQAFVAAATTAVSMGIGGAALEKAVLGRTGTGLGNAMQALGDFAKTGTKIAIKEGVSEAGEEGITQAALEGQLYKIDPTRDVAKEITQAAAFGMIAGGPIAGGAYGASRTGDVISNAIQGNSKVADILETNKGNPAAADAALVKFGITDNVVKSNLMNTVDNANYTSSAEAANSLAARGDYTYSDADVTALTGKGTDGTLANRVEAYVDPRVFDIAEVKAAAAAEGYTLTDAEAAKLVGQKDEATATTAARTQFDPLATTSDEARAFFTSRGYTPSADEIKQFVGSKSEADQIKAVGDYVNPRQVTTAEARKYLTDLGYKPSDAEVNRFVGQVNEAEQAKAIGAYVDPRMVDEGEVKAAYEALGLKQPTADDIKKLIGQYDEAGLTAKATENLPTARFNSIMAQLDEMSSGGVSEEARAAIDLVRKDLTKSIADTGLEVAKVALKVDTAKADLEKAIKTATSGLATPADVDKAIANIKFPAGLSKEDVSSAIKTYMQANPGLSLADVASKVAEATKGLATTDAVKTEIAAALKTTEGRFDTIDKAIQDLRDAGLTADDVRATVDKIVGSAGTDKTAATGVYAHIDGVNTKIDNINKLIGAPAEGGTAATGLYAKIAANEAAGMKRDEAAQKAIADVAAELGTTKTALLESLGTTEGNLTRKIEGLETALSTTEKKILDKVAEYEKAGLTRDEATQKAISTVATDLGTTKADLLKQLGTTEANLTKSIDTLSKDVGALGTKLEAVETNLLAKIAENEKAGLTREQATQKAVADLATELGTSKADILKQIGATETTLNTKIADLQTQVGKDVKAVETNLLDKIAENEKAGLTRDQATQKAVADLAIELGTTKEGLLTQLGTTEANLTAKIAGVSTDLQTKYDALTTEQKALATQLTNQGIDLNTAIATAKGEVQTQIGALQDIVGRGTQQATQSDLDAVIKMLESQGAYDPQYDYNGDRVIDQKDKVAIETYLRSQQPDYKPDTEDPFTYNPAAGSKWAPTGVFKTMADEAERTRQSAINEAERTRQEQAARTDALAKANAAAALKTQRMGNLNSLMGMLGQAQDIGGQQVTVKAADPAKIGYIYDWNSIFANPSQANMFVSPFAQGGMVDGSDDVNDELLKILKG